MNSYEKYAPTYFVPPVMTYDWVKKEKIEKAPLWCSVDLRDGNQALIEPMSLDEKLEFFEMLVKLGFKEIEIGFPAASDTEFAFTRALIERNMIPEDVTIQVLTQAREHIIKKTFEAVKGAPRAIIHVYNSTSLAQREQVFKKSKEEIKKIAIDGATLLKKLADETEGNFAFEYSPESFSGTEMDYALEVVNAVLDVWQPRPDFKPIINLPMTVENMMPHIAACQIEYFHKNMKYRENVVLSLHPHNDRGCGVANAELCMLAGADRCEGTLFGNGERTGNVDIVTLAMNMVSHGVNPELDLSNMPKIRATYERLTRMQVPPRHPYAGDLVFTAFSGSHQDAIAKGMAIREQNPVIRFNSQSGKGGIGYILKNSFGIILPDKMRESVSYFLKGVSDRTHSELTPHVIYDNFKKEFVDKSGSITVTDIHFRQEDGIVASVTFAKADGTSFTCEGHGNGRLDAVSNAIKKEFEISYKIVEYSEHALTTGSSSEAMAYVCINMDDNVLWGAGIDSDIIKASINALVVAVNRALAD